MEKRKPTKKKSYEKPCVRRVTLHPEESMVAGCKSLSVGGPAAPASSCIVPGQCFADGS